jgi:hypothetical protein
MLMKTAYLAQPTGPSFPAVGHGGSQVSLERHRAYFIVDRAGAEAERERATARHTEYDWKLEEIKQSGGPGFIVVGHPRAGAS